MIFPNKLNSPIDGILEIEFGNNPGISFEESEESFMARGQRIVEEQQAVIKRLTDYNRKSLNMIISQFEHI